MIWFVVGLAVFAGASVLALYSYGRFAASARGEPAFAMPLDGTVTVLDTATGPLTASHAGQTGMVLVSENLQAFALRAHLARTAGRSLDLQYYYWLDDLTGGLLAQEIVAAADRGVRVRLLLDDINIRSGDRMFQTLDRHPNIEVRLFNPSRARDGAIRRSLEMMLRAVSATRRMHNKAWIADGRLAIVGGRNIGDAYFDAADGANFHDMDLLLLGSAVQQTEQIFDSFWNSEAVIPVAKLVRRRGRDLDDLRRRIRDLAGTHRAEPYIRRLMELRDSHSLMEHRSRIHWSASTCVVSDPPRKVRGAASDAWLIRTITPLMQSAQRRLEITSPYFIPGEKGVAALTELVERGVEVVVLTNSLAATDVAAVHGAYANYRTTLVRNGVAIHELRLEISDRDMSLFGSSGASLHTKAFTVDQCSGFVGSFNFDPRSVSLNTEMGVIFDHPELAGELVAAFAREIDARASYRVIVDDHGLGWEDGTGPGAVVLRREPQAGAWRRLVARLIGRLPIESQL